MHKLVRGDTVKSTLYKLHKLKLNSNIIQLNARKEKQNNGIILIIFLSEGGES